VSRGAKDVTELENGWLFFPEDQPDALAKPMLKFWEEWSKP
jgi:hypothetical protein